MLALANPLIEARCDGIFEKRDMKKEKKARYTEIKLLSQNHEEKQIATGVRN